MQCARLPTLRQSIIDHYRRLQTQYTIRQSNHSTVARRQQTLTPVDAM